MKVIAQPAFGVRENNPYTWLLYHKMPAQVTDFSYRRSFADYYDIFHIHWPEWELNEIHSATKAAARLKLKLMLIDALRARGTKIVWTVHNLKSHEGLHPRLEEWFWSAFTRKLDGFISLTDSGRDAAKERFPSLKHVPSYVIPHGHYRDEYPLDVCTDARKQVGISSDAKVILFFGQIREYKNVPALIRAFRAIKGKNVILCIAGRPNPNTLARELRAASSDDPRIHLHLENIPKERVQFFFRAADLVTLPYRDILNSGTALLALSFNRPILVPKRGAMSDLQGSVGTEWVRQYHGDLKAEDLEHALTWATESPRLHVALLSDLEWPKIAGQTLKAYDEIISRRE